MKGYNVKNTIISYGLHYLTNMSSVKFTITLFLGVCLSCQVAITSCEVVSVSRNVTDSFRVGKDGCVKNVNVCTPSATCQKDGSCLCKPEFSSYRDRVIEMMVNGTLTYGATYGCSKDEYIRKGVEGGKCI